MQKKIRILLVVVSMGALSSLYFNCSRANITPLSANTGEGNLDKLDRSSSGMVATAIGGAIASSAQGSKFSFRQNHSSLFESEAYAGNSCPTILSSGPNSGCINDLVNTNNINLIYQDCNFFGSSATWNGILKISQANGTAVHCGAFPIPTSTALERQFIDQSGNPDKATRHAANGLVISIDNSTSGGTLVNFDNAPIVPTIGSGYGTSVTFDANHARTQANIAEHLWGTANSTTLFDHTVVGTADLDETNNVRMVTTANITIYHNILQIIGMSTFTNVTYDNTCCTPISGSISTAFSAGVNTAPTTLGATFVGKSETLTFSSCGKATLQDVNGLSSDVEMACF